MHIKCEFGGGCVPGRVPNVAARAKKFVVLPSRSVWWPGTDGIGPCHMPVCTRHLKRLPAELEGLPKIRLNEGFNLWVVQFVLNS